MLCKRFLKRILNRFSLYPSLWGSKGYIFRRGRWFEKADKGIEVSLTNEGEFYFELSKGCLDKKGEKDTTVYFSLTMLTPFKKGE